MFTSEVAMVVDEENDRREKLYRQQEALQEPGAINKFLDEVKALGGRVAEADLEAFNLIKIRAKEIVDINVGVVENPDVYLQSEVNNEILRLTDEIFKREHPKVYALAREAILKDLPKGIDIYNGGEVRSKLILASLNPVIRLIRRGLNQERWQVVAGIKPIRSATMEVLRNSLFGEGDLERYGEFGELERRLEKFEEDIETDSQKQDIFKRLISERHDRVRCRIYTNSKFNLNYLMGDIRYRPVDLIKQVTGQTPDWNYYMSRWLYKNNGEIRIDEIADRNGPSSSFGFFQSVARHLNPDDLVYVAWHAHLKLRRILGPKLPIEMQVFPVEFAAMHNLLERVYKQDNPDINAVSPVLRKKVNWNAIKFLESE